MAESTGLVISRLPRNRLMMAMDGWPWERTLPYKPAWMDLADWINLLVWLILVTGHNEPPDQAWYRNIDRAFDALRSALRKKRIVNIDELRVATEALYSTSQAYRNLCPLMYPILTSVYPQIQDGYRISFHHMDVTGVYLILAQE